MLIFYFLLLPGNTYPPRPDTVETPHIYRSSISLQVPVVSTTHEEREESLFATIHSHKYIGGTGPRAPYKHPTSGSINSSSQSHSPVLHSSNGSLPESLPSSIYSSATPTE